MNIEHAKKIKARLKDTARRFEFEDPDETPVFASPLQLADFVFEGQSVAEALRFQLLCLGVSDSWILDRSTIYQHAVVNLAQDLFCTGLPDYLGADALQELMLLTQSLYRLFTDKVRISHTRKNNHYLIVEGYHTTLDNQTRRVVAQNRPDLGYSENHNRLVFPGTQIEIKDILGRNDQGLAIAGDDSALRIGLRLGGPIEERVWTVSIDSGLQFIRQEADSSEDPKEWKTIRPLSQAIYQAKLSPHTAVSLDTDPNRYTYHYDDPDSRLGQNRETQLMFNVFNRHLGEIFRRLAH